MQDWCLEPSRHPHISPSVLPEAEMAGNKATERQRTLRGRAYSLEEFQKKYHLDTRTAEDLFSRFGPSSIELDLLMSAKRKAVTIQSVTSDLHA